MFLWQSRNLYRNLNKGVKLKQRQCLFVCGNERQCFDCVQSGGGTKRCDAGVFHCQPIPWAWINFDKAPFFAVTLLVWSDNEDVFFRITVKQTERVKETMSLCSHCLEFSLQDGRMNGFVSTLCETFYSSPHLPCIAFAFASVDMLSFVTGLGSNICQSFYWNLLLSCTGRPIAQLSEFKWI